jgi:hypothetical protein
MKPPGPAHKRLSAVQLGKARIAQAVDRSVNTLQTWFRRNLQGGVAELVRDGPSDSPRAAAGEPAREPIA